MSFCNHPVNTPIQGSLECFLRASLSFHHLLPPAPEMPVDTAVTGSIQAHKHPFLPMLLPLKKHKTSPTLQPSSFCSAWPKGLEKQGNLHNPRTAKCWAVFGARRGAPCSANAPELVHPGQGGNGPVPNVAGVVDLAVLHFHLGVFQPEGDVPVVHVQGALVDGTGSGKHEYRAGKTCLPDSGARQRASKKAHKRRRQPRRRYLWISFRLSSHCAYFIQLLITVLFFLMLSSKV